MQAYAWVDQPISSLCNRVRAREQVDPTCVSPPPTFDHVQTPDMEGPLACAGRQRWKVGRRAIGVDSKLETDLDEPKD